MSLSTHVLNTTTGLPEEGLTFQLTTEDGAQVESGRTDADGRHRFTTPLEQGVHRLRFDTGDHLAGTATLYPYVDITFFVTDGRGGDGGHLHIPLLLSPFGYSTYQGS